MLSTFCCNISNIFLSFQVITRTWLLDITCTKGLAFLIWIAITWIACPCYYDSLLNLIKMECWKNIQSKLQEKRKKLRKDLSCIPSGTVANGAWCMFRSSFKNVWTEDSCMCAVLHLYYKMIAPYALDDLFQNPCEKNGKKGFSLIFE